MEPSPPETPEIDALRAAYAALNRGDVDGFVACFDADVLRIEPAEPASAGTFRGIAAVTEHVRVGRGSWAEGTCEPERFLVVRDQRGDRVIVFAKVHVRLKSETTWRDGQATDVFTFRDGRAIEFRTFFDEREGLAYAGVDATR